jgi:hypothetical protein
LNSCVPPRNLRVQTHLFAGHLAPSTPNSLTSKELPRSAPLPRESYAYSLAPVAADGVSEIQSGSTPGRQEHVMQIKRALVFCKDQKTDAELKAIMAEHPWSGGGPMHGFYKASEEEWEPDGYLIPRPDGVWVDEGVNAYGTGEKWVVENFHAPGHPRSALRLESGRYWHLISTLEKEWWRVTTELILRQIPSSYHAYTIYYGEIEDEYDPWGDRGGDAAVAEQAWHEGIGKRFDYAPEVMAAVGA